MVGGWDYYTTFFVRTIFKIEIVLYSLQILFLVLYLFPKARFKFQKLQTLVVLLYAFQQSTILFTLLIVSEMANNSIDQTTLMYAGLLLLLGAVIVHIVATIDTFRKVSKGHLVRLYFLIKQRRMQLSVL
ncbi:hypothetical protein SAMN04488168_1398 [Bacillus sp. 491mf]|nr:hypothetical protein SAMN04488168_1398 [Bacillus sp. 491mf]